MQRTLSAKNSKDNDHLHNPNEETGKEEPELIQSDATVSVDGNENIGPEREWNDVGALQSRSKKLTHLLWVIR